ncbi:MAG: CBS domain-containing protein [Planctomycetes bacterium]|nr:CBS domain-containing protein [Planctomycetota bacterium]
MILSEVMTPNPKTCSLDDSVQICAKLMSDANLGFLPVVDDYGTLAGVITDRDIAIRAVAQGKNPETRVRFVYSDNPLHLEEADTLAQAEDLMMEAHVRRIVIIDEEKKPIGVVSASDVCRCEKDLERMARVFGTICEPTVEGRTVERFVGSSCCG